MSNLVTSEIVINDLHKAAEAISNLKARWQDEGEFEDFAQYVKVAEKAIQAPYKFVSLTKQFRLTVTRGEQTFELRIGLSGVSARQVGGPKSASAKAFSPRDVEKFLKPSDREVFFVEDKEIRLVAAKKGVRWTPEQIKITKARIIAKYPQAKVLHDMPRAAAIKLISTCTNA